jgi:hypothetical protein
LSINFNYILTVEKSFFLLLLLLPLVHCPFRCSDYFRPLVPL